MAGIPSVVRVCRPPGRAIGGRRRGQSTRSQSRVNAASNCCGVPATVLIQIVAGELQTIVETLGRGLFCLRNKQGDFMNRIVANRRAASAAAGQIVRDQPGVKEQVGVYLDESVISLSLFTPDVDLYDLNRVETLRGPQGTLFGSGSVGGTIRYITNQPNMTRMEGSLEANI